MEKTKNNFMFEVYKERKTSSGWQFIVLSTQFFKTEEAAKAYANGCSFLLKQNERFVVMNRYNKKQEIITYDARKF